jgi:hypothetical protein
MQIWKFSNAGRVFATGMPMRLRLRGWQASWLAGGGNAPLLCRRGCQRVVVHGCWWPAGASKHFIIL